MKKIVLLLFFILTGMSLRAQMMPDSTVQFVAYWNVGDKYQYNFESIDKEVDANGDTTIVKQSYEVIEFEVVAKTDESYQIKMTTMEEENSDPQGKLIDKIFKEYGADIPVLFSTNNLGSLQSIDNLQELSSSIANAMEPLAQAILKEQGLEAKDLEGFDMQGFMQELLKQTTDPSLIQTSILDYIGRLFFFHGARLEIDHTYSFEEPLNFMIPGIEQLTATTNFWADGEYTDEYSSICRTYTSANVGKETVVSALGTYSDMAAEFIEDADTLKTDIKEIINKGVADVDINISWEQYTTTEIHLNTGWPLRHYQDKYVKAGEPGKDTAKETIESRYIEIILSE